MNGNEVLTLTSADETTTERLAAIVARQCQSQDCFLLRGDLGAGKTVFSRGFIKALTAEQEDIISPTFTLLQTYATLGGQMIWHFDLYRLRSPQELEEIGLEDALGSGITLIEWPEMAERIVGPAALNVSIRIGMNPEERLIEFSGLSSVWKDRLEAMKDTVS